MTNNKTVLITGAAGFIGSHLAAHHISLGHNVIGVDDFSSSSKYSKHLLELNKAPNFKFIKCSINDRDELLESIAAIVNITKISLIYNMACPASPPRYQAQPVHTLLTSTTGMNNILEFATRFCMPGCVVLQASTSEVYGDPLVTPQKEEYWGNVNSYGPRSCYDEGKRAAEALCYDYLKKYNLDVRVARIFNTYGPHMDPDDGRVVSNFLNQVLAGKPLTLYGDGSQTRSLCYISDTVNALHLIATHHTNLGMPINVGSTDELTMSKLAIEVQTVALKNVGIKYENLPVDDPKVRCPDLTILHSLDWTPKVSLTLGLQKTFQYFRQLRGFDN